MLARTHMSTIEFENELLTWIVHVHWSPMGCLTAVTQLSCYYHGSKFSRLSHHTRLPFGHVSNSASPFFYSIQRINNGNDSSSRLHRANITKFRKLKWLECMYAWMKSWWEKNHSPQNTNDFYVQCTYCVMSDGWVELSIMVKRRNILYSR